MAVGWHVMFGKRAGTCVSGPKRNRTDEALRKRFKAEEQQAIDALARWIGHPAVGGVVERRRVGAETVVMPIARHLTGQVEVIRFCWHAYEIAGIEPGWELRRGQPWLLTVSELNAIERVEADFRGVVQLAVNELYGAGVGLVPSWTGDHVVVGELLLLDMAWDLPADELAEALQPPAIGAIHVDASGTVHRRGSGERANNNIGALRRAYERHRYGRPPRAPYAGGGMRALPESTRRRLEVLGKVRERWPGVTASKIITTFGDHGLQRGGQAGGCGCSTRNTSLTSRKPGGGTCCTACARSKMLTAWPGTSSSPSPTSNAATCGAQPPTTWARGR